MMNALLMEWCGINIAWEHQKTVSVHGDEESKTVLFISQTKQSGDSVLC